MGDAGQQLGLAGAFGLAALAGASFSLIGIAYRLGQTRGIAPPQILLITALFGTAFYGLRCRDVDWTQVPLWVVGVGVLAGFTQYLLVKLFGMALKRGPLSPVWCAVSLGFVPVILYAAAAFDEPVSLAQSVAILAAILCVIVASTGQGQGKGQQRHQAEPVSPPDAVSHYNWQSSAIYAVLLLTMLVVNSVTDVGMKDLGTRLIDGVADVGVAGGSTGAAGDSYLARYGDLFLTLFYACLAAGVLADLLMARAFKVPLGTVVALGSLAAVGSVGGLLATKLCAGSQAAMTFTVRGAVSILAASVVSVIAFGEALNRRWVGTVGLGIVAVVLAAPWQSPATQPARTAGQPSLAPATAPAAPAVQPTDHSPPSAQAHLWQGNPLARSTGVPPVAREP